MSFNELLAAHLGSLPDGFVAAVEAERFRDWMRAEHPEVLSAWLAEQELRAIHRAIIDHDRADRTRVRNRAVSRAFAERYPEELSAFDIRFVVDEENLRKRVADMTGADHAFVADRYQASANRELMLCEFHRAVATKVGKRRTADVLDVEQYESLQRSITGAVRIGDAA